MASTNHTTNYSLSQFTQTDKPAWLGDYNQDMSKIDTGMKANADSITTLGTTVSRQGTAISGNTSSIESLQTTVSGIADDIDTLETSVGNAQTKADSAYTLADTANGKADTNSNNIASQGLEIASLQTDVATNTSTIASQGSSISNLQSSFNEFETKFNLTSIDTISSITGYSSIMNDAISLTLAQNTDGSIFKLYGYCSGYQSSTTTASLTAVTGLNGYYGIKTTLKLNTAPEDAYVIKSAGIYRDTYQGNVAGLNDINLAVDSEGYIYVCVTTQSTLQYQSYHSVRNIYFSCIYFNGTFGDTPTPPSE